MTDQETEAEWVLLRLSLPAGGAEMHIRADDIERLDRLKQNGWSLVATRDQR